MRWIRRAGIAVIAILGLCGVPGGARAEQSGINLGALYRTLWTAGPRVALGEAEATSAISGLGSYLDGRFLGMLEVGQAEMQGSEFAAVLVAYAYPLSERTTLYLGGGLDSRRIFHEAGVGPALAAGAIVPLTEGARLNVQVRGSFWAGSARESTLSLNIGYHVPI